MRYDTASRRRFARLGTALVILMATTPGAATAYLGAATGFAVLAGVGLTNSGDSIVNGDLGLVSGVAMAGLAGLSGIHSLHFGDDTVAAAKADAAAARAIFEAMATTVDLSGQDLGTLAALTPGVYRFAAAAQLTGTLTLDFTGNPDADFIFLIGSALTTATGSNIVVRGGGSGSGVYFDVGSSATLGTNSIFAGNILARTAITINHAARILCGRAIALDAAVTMDGNAISNDCRGGDLGSGRSDFSSGGFAGGDITPVPEPGAWALLITGFGLVGTVLRRGRDNAPAALSSRLKPGMTALF
jgi:type VI secretion system secreted protein VgrG